MSARMLLATTNAYYHTHLYYVSISEIHLPRPNRLQEQLANAPKEFSEARCRQTGQGHKQNVTSRLRDLQPPRFLRVLHSTFTDMSRG